MVVSADIEEYKQKVEEEIGSEIKVSPKHIRNYGTSNIFQRAFSYLFGWTKRGIPVKLAATEEGSLKVATTGAGLEETERRTGTAGSTESSAISFSETVSKVMIYTKTHDLYFRPSPNGVKFYDQIICLGANSLMLDLIVKSFKVQRATTNDTDFEVVGMR